MNLPRGPGHFAAIGALTDAEAILKGEAGTFVAPPGTWPSQSTI